MTSGGYHRASDMRWVRLSCGHIITYRSPFPKLFDYVQCPKCWMGQAVVAIEKEERTAEQGQWHAKCSNCRFSRKYKTNKLSAERGAVHHHSLQPTHCIYLFTPEGKLWHTFLPMNHKDLLF